MSFFRKKIVVRMAPSPTGHLHIGTARTALFNYIFAQKHKGEFILRIEDTDKKRSKREYEEEIQAGLTWLGISWKSVFRQSERTEIYKKYLEKMLKSGKAYLSKEESRTEAGKEVEVIRLKNPNKLIKFYDEVRGEIAFDTTDLGDFVIARSLEEPLYHLTVVVDDMLMKVTHVIRGEDHISNTPRQILIQKALGATTPKYVHLPLILAADKSKLSKRHGAVMLEEYKKQGFLPEAIVNYLALLGWNPGTDQELFSFDELIKSFDLSGIQKGGAVFDVEKLKWFNREYLKLMSDTEFKDYIEPEVKPYFAGLAQYSPQRFERFLPTLRERTYTHAETRKEVERGDFDFIFSRPEIDITLLKWKSDDSIEETLPRLRKLVEIFSSIPEEAEAEDIKTAIWDYATEVGKGEVLWPLRVALTGRKQSPDPFTVSHIIGVGESYKRIKNAYDTILSSR